MVVCCYFAEMLQNDVRGKKTEQPRNWRTLDGEYNRERTQTRTDVKKESNLENVSWIFGVEASSTPQPPQNTQADTHTHTHTHTHAHAHAHAHSHAYACINARHN